MSVQQYFTSQKNYLKRHPSSGSASITAPSTLRSWGNYTTTFTVSHNLGYVPQVRVFYENSASDNKVYPAGGTRLAASYPGIAGSPIFCLWDVDSTTLTIILESGTTKTGVRNIYWVVYWDSE